MISVMRKRRGFTFIELAISLTIFAIIAAGIYSTFMAGIRIWRWGDEEIETNQPTRIFFDRVSLDLKNAVSYTTGTGGVNFEGLPQRMSFMTVADISDASSPLHGELAKAAYYFESEKKSVMRSIATVREGFDEQYAAPLKVYEGVDDAGTFGFQYCYKPEGEGGEYLWKDTWDKPDKIPRGVRIKAGGLTKTVLIPTGILGGE